ncbi:uncharacterized protein C2845_PM12G25640 [Panicum miliaceum]|uniref:Uncharacterized protein n=1 Tax=Panicum miliaceum TaxID=4540 RepID=A0A3L6QIV5_PANMI|nr:uncharacterized protein C2845_PM12G25640 [Panicum miliaceum]
MAGEDELLAGGGVPIRPPRLEDAGLEDCALPPESIAEAFSLAAAAVSSRLARFPLSDDEEEDEEGAASRRRAEASAWTERGPSAGPSPTPTPLSSAAPMRSWSSAEGAEAGARMPWWSAGAGKSRMESWSSGNGAGRRIWGRRMDASRGSGKA